MVLGSFVPCISSLVHLSLTVRFPVHVSWASKAKLRLRLESQEGVKSQQGILRTALGTLKYMVAELCN